jgi:hypothetical protein
MVIGCAGGVGAPGVNELIPRFDGEVAAGAGEVAGAFVPLLWAKTLLAVHGNINRTPPKRIPCSRVGRNFINTLFPA